MKLIAVQKKVWWEGKEYSAGDEIENHEPDSVVKLAILLGRVKAASIAETRVMTPEPIVENPPPAQKSNINPATGKRYYRHRQMKAED